MAEPARVKPANSWDAAQEFARVFSEREAERVAGLKRLSPCHTNRASSIGDPCLRRLFYRRTAWDQAALPDDVLQLIFGEGNLHEEDVRRRLAELGFRIIRSQVAGSWPSVDLSGHIDGLIEFAGFPILAESKSMSGNTWPRLNTWEDARDGHGSLWYARYWYAQVTAYCLLEAVEAGALILKNKQTGQIKVVPVPLDYEFAERLMRKSEAVRDAVAVFRAHVESGATPEAAREEAAPPHVDDPTECDGCEFFGRVCQPPSFSGQADVVVDADLLEQAEVWKELRGPARRWADVDSALKERLKLAAKLSTPTLVGPLEARVEERTRKAYAVEAGSYRQVSLKVVGEGRRA